MKTKTIIVVLTTMLIGGAGMESIFQNDHARQIGNSFKPQADDKSNKGQNTVSLNDSTLTAYLSGENSSGQYLNELAAFDLSTGNKPRMPASEHFESQVTTCRSETSSDAVEMAWVARYNGPGNGYDEAYAIAVDESGNVYVTGRSWGAGTQIDYATIKYNNAGEEQWVARYNGPGNGYDEAYDIALDGSGNVYVTGWSLGSAAKFEYATIKYNNAGEEQWVARYSGKGNDNWAYALAVDASGNAYVTGRSEGVGGSSDYATIKYSSDGEEQWVQRYNGPGYGDDWATDLAVDASGNVYVTGRSWGSENDLDYTTIKYNSEGEERWVARYSGPCNGNDWAFAIDVDESGYVYVTGRSWGSETDFDYATIKYNSEGEEQWAARYNGPGNDWDQPSCIAVDASGNVYVTGFSVGLELSSECTTIKYNSEGEEQWVARYGIPGSSYNIGRNIAVDESGNVYVTGQSDGVETSSDYATVKYNSEGEEQWVARYHNDFDYASAIAVDASGHVYVTGSSWDAATEYDYVTIKYAQAAEVIASSPVKHEIMIYPNPAKDHFNIRSGYLIFHIKVTDLRGRVIHSQPVNHTETRVEKSLKTGVYIVSINTDEGVFQRKLLVR